MSININRVKSLKLNDLVWADGYKATVYSLPNLDGDMQIILDEGLWTETIYNCNIHDITLDNDGDYVLDTEFVPIVGDIISINEKEYRLVDIDDGVVVLQRGDEIRYYSFYDIAWDIMDGYWISSICEQVSSPTAKRKLKVYEVQDNVYLYISLDELKEIYELLGEPSIQGGDSCIDTFIDSLEYKYGLVHHWEDYDSFYSCAHKYVKVIDGGCIKSEL